MKISNKVIATSENFKSPPPQQVKKPAENESQIYRWIGLKDCADALTAYQKKDYTSAVNSLAVAFLKFGTIGAAAFGTYKWICKDTVYLNDFMKQAEVDFSKENAKSSVPASVVNMTNTFYDEYKKFSKWPKSGQAFFDAHLQKNAPMSSSIVKHLMTEGAKHNDSSFEKLAINKCVSAYASSMSCMAILEYLTKTPSPESLETAIKISRRCKTSNPFCNKALEGAQTRSINKESIDEARTLIVRMTRKGANQGKGADFLKDVIVLFNEQFREFEKVITNCKNAKTTSGVWDTAACFSQAPWFQKPRILFGKSDFLEWNEYDAIDNLKTALSDYGQDLAKACTQFPDSEPCNQFVSNIFQKFIDYNLIDEAFELLSKKGPLQKNEVEDVITTMAQKNQWIQGTRFIEKVQASNPKLDIQTEIDAFNQLMTDMREDAEDALKSMSDPKNSESELSAAVERAFSLQDEEQLFNIFKVAKSWIGDHNTIQHPEALKLVIRNLFALDFCKDRLLNRCSEKESLNGDMAKVLVTLWRRSNGYYDYSTRTSWPLYSKLDYNDRYSRAEYTTTINKSNWEQLIR